MENFKLGFVGAGNMAQAILYGILDHKLASNKSINIYDVAQTTLDKVVTKTGVIAASSNKTVIENSDMIILAVKPMYCEDILVEFRELFQHKALLSIVSGWSYNDLKKQLPESCRIQVVQPNTPLLVAAGMTFIASTTNFSIDEQSYVKEIFSVLGRVEIVRDDLLMLCGTSGGASPAFVFLFIEAMADASVEEGIPRDVAYRICAQAVLGAGKMVLESGMHPGALKDQICSPKGSTILGIHSLEKSGFRGAIMEAVKAANNRWR